MSQAIHTIRTGVRRIPPLKDGDALDSREFLRRYQAMPGLRKAELIEGTVRMPSPVRAIQHAKPDSLIQGWLLAYSARNPAAESFTNPTVIFEDKSVPQPDAVLRLAIGGASHIDPDGFLRGSPEMLVEISASTASADTKSKLRLYRRNGVREYLVWRVLENALDWWVLEEDGEYILNEADARGFLQSRTFPDLKLRLAALLALDAAAVLAGLAE